MYTMYKALTSLSAPFLTRLLNQRSQKGKEVPERLDEKKGITTASRPAGKLVWVHAASVGEAQSALILIEKLNEQQPDLHFLVTTGTVTSAELMKAKLPNNATHQFYPFDHPKWVKRFLDHWTPNAVLWMESEIWPNMLNEIKARNIEAFLINARMSPKSFSLWRVFRPLARQSLSAFDKILCQTAQDEFYYTELGGANIQTTDNLKYSSAPLSYSGQELEQMRNAVNGRPVWVYASTHQGEEEIACNTHRILKDSFPNLLTIIVPRHPQRRLQIKEACDKSGLAYTFRGEEKDLPKDSDDMYVVDTLGELGLFYALSPIACIGRTFSNDGGGGHNPIEAAQLNCAILHGVNVQNLQDIFDDMDHQSAALPIAKPEDLATVLKELLTDSAKLEELQQRAKDFTAAKNKVIDRVMAEITL